MAQVADTSDVHVEAPPAHVAKPAEVTDRPIQRRENLPPVAGGAYTIPPSDFYDYTAKLNERDWMHVEGYVFRLRPRILRLPPLDKNIGHVTGPIDQRWILENFGSGKYQVRLNDTDRTSKKGVCETFIDLDDPDYPPKYDIRELDIVHRDNRQLIEHLKRTGKLTADGEVIVEKAPENADATANTALRDIALEAMRGKNKGGGMDASAISKMMEMAQASNAKQLDLVINLLKPHAGGDPMMGMLLQFMLKQMELADKRAESKPSSDSGILTLMMKQIELAEKRAEAAEQRSERDRQSVEADKQRQHEKDMEMLKQRQNAADPMEMIDKVLGIKERLTGDEGPAKNRKWPEMLIEDHASDLFELGKAAFGALGNYKRGPAAVPPVQTAPQPRPAPAQPAPVITVTPVPQSTGAEPMPAPNAQPVDPDIAFLVTIFLEYGPKLVKAFADDPNSGGELAGAISSPFVAGKSGYERIARMGRDKILAAIAEIPQMKMDIEKAGSAEMLNDFIDDFIDPDGDDDDDEQQPVIPEGTRKPKPGKKAVQ